MSTLAATVLQHQGVCGSRGRSRHHCDQRAVSAAFIAQTGAIDGSAARPAAAALRRGAGPDPGPRRGIIPAGAGGVLRPGLLGLKLSADVVAVVLRCAA